MIGRHWPFWDHEPDDDGPVVEDLVVGVHNGTPRVLHNTAGSAGAFLELELVGTTSNRDAIGSCAVVELSDRRLVRWQIPQQGFQGTQDRRVHFGLGVARRAWLEARQVLNTFSFEGLRAVLAKKR